MLLVTGGAGFIGSNVVAALNDAGRRDVVVNDPHLTIPHIEIESRAFVLIPFAEIAPDVVHPIRKTTIGELAAQVATRGDVKRIGEYRFLGGSVNLWKMASAFVWT